MDRRAFLKTASAALTGGSLAPGLFAADNPRKPNILMILADDATYNDFPLYGGVNVRTPRIDRLAAEGMTFSKAYLSMAICVPCRTELYTGLYPMRSGCCWNHAPARIGTRSICHFLRDLGYRVGLTGKLHVSPRSCFPFDKVEGFEDNCVAETADYNCRGIRAYMEADKSQPFCLIVGLVLPHAVWTVGDANHFDPEKLKLPANLADTPQTRQDYASYLAEIEVLDQQVGDILDTLEQTGQADNTLVLFSTEQGSQFPGCKWTNYECGLHTGITLRWPGVVKPGVRTEAMIQYADILPTLIEAAGGTVPTGQFDGTSFLEVLTGKKDGHRRYTYGMHNNIPEGGAYPIRSARDSRYRYIRNLLPERVHIQRYVMGPIGNKHTHYWSSWMLAAVEDEKAYQLVSRYLKRPGEELYDSNNDPYELNNLADNPQYADVKRRLSEELDQWMKEQSDPGAVLDTLQRYNQARGKRNET
ncbi:MAG: sulfatase [Anaerohalosphaeraceae bacterium]